MTLLHIYTLALVPLLYPLFRMALMQLRGWVGCIPPLALPALKLVQDVLVHALSPQHDTCTRPPSSPLCPAYVDLPGADADHDAKVIVDEARARVDEHDHRVDSATDCITMPCAFQCAVAVSGRWVLDRAIVVIKIEFVASPMPGPALCWSKDRHAGAQTSKLLITLAVDPSGARARGL